MEVLVKEGAFESEGKVGNLLIDLNGGESEEISSSSDFLASEITLNDSENTTSEDSSSHSEMSQEVDKIHLEKQGSSLSEFEMMRERFSKLLLGEDMSGCGNGVSTALAISNAITNLCATLFGQVWRLEPLQIEKKRMWKREMEWLLSVSDHIVELMPSWQTFPDGTKLRGYYYHLITQSCELYESLLKLFEWFIQVMTSRPRSDLYINLPAIRKLDNMLLEILDCFENSEFWYVDQGIITPDIEGSSSFKKPLPRQEEKWWLPVPRVPHGGLSENGRKRLQHTRDCTNQILKAALAINSATLAEMAIPDSYLEALPKNGKTSLGDLIHRYINSDQFSPECLLDCLDLSSDHHALEIANRIETTIYVWRRRNSAKPLQRSSSKSSWEMVKDLVSDGDKRDILADRAESLLLCLKQRFPGLPQTTLDMTKIQCNKDVAKSILESYSRVLESLAFNIVARIDDVLYVDGLSKHSDQVMPFSKVGLITQKSIIGTPYKTAFSTPSSSPYKGDRSPYIESSKHSLHGFGFKRILTDYLSIDGKGKEVKRSTRSLDSFSSTTREMSASPSVESNGGSKGIISPRTDVSVEDE